MRVGHLRRTKPFRFANATRSNCLSWGIRGRSSLTHWAFLPVRFRRTYPMSTRSSTCISVRRFSVLSGSTRPRLTKRRDMRGRESGAASAWSSDYRADRSGAGRADDYSCVAKRRSHRAQQPPLVSLIPQMVKCLCIQMHICGIDARSTSPVRKELPCR